MSELLTLQIECPRCAHHYEQDFFRTLWGDNPDLRRQVMTDQVNIARCPRCGHHFHLPMAMLYVDAAARFAIWWEPRPDPDIDTITEAFAQALGPRSYYVTAPRVKHWTAFKQAITAFYQRN